MGFHFCLTMSYPTQPNYPAQPSPFQQPGVYSPAVPQTGGFGPTQYAAAPAEFAPGFTPNRAANPNRNYIIIAVVAGICCCLIIVILLVIFLLVPFFIFKSEKDKLDDLHQQHRSREQSAVLHFG
ncbi:hypothetical protein Ocin01_19357 [Orchesella cincta]|uniref:Uncharacterized protein n=1 Tax=Orchesella cincta TaxID=48709 RepID=A0A1D2M2Y1_ORCCI|nr:hypothetical protein Ocin01_19357 [Orchesella cincta]